MMISATETVIGWLNMAGKSISDEQNRKSISGMHVDGGINCILPGKMGGDRVFFESARVYRLPRLNWIMS